MTPDQMYETFSQMYRVTEAAQPGDELLGPLKELPGVWKNKPGLEGRGWNMIALPFIVEGERIDYRILMNQYNEELKFSVVDKAVPNRGVIKEDDENLNQFIVTIDYEQFIEQIAAEDMPVSGMAGATGQAIHHEPGLFLNMTNFTTNGQDIARLGTIPHGNSVLAMGKSEELTGAPTIPDVNVLPIGATQDINSGYLTPYKHFSDNPFQGLFNVLDPSGLLRAATPANVVRTTKLEMDTKVETGGILNIPFIKKHADASEMKSTFWIMETSDRDDDGKPVFIMQYMQIVMLDFFPRFGDESGLVQWPHVSFNTMRRFSQEQSELSAY